MYYLRLIEVLTAEYPTTRTHARRAGFRSGVPRVSRASSLDRADAAVVERRFSQVSEAASERPQARAACSRRRAHRTCDGRRVRCTACRSRCGFEALKRIPADRWGAMRLTLTPALRLLALDCAAGHVHDGGAITTQGARAAARPSFVIVYRKNLRAWRMTVTREQFQLLGAARQGLADRPRCLPELPQAARAAERLAALLLRAGSATGPPQGLFVGLTGSHAVVSDCA